MKTNVKINWVNNSIAYTLILCSRKSHYTKLLGGNGHENFDIYSKLFICKMTENQPNSFICTVLCHFTHASDMLRVLL